jgi:hypothetical protein
VKSSPDQCDQKYCRYVRTASGLPSVDQPLHEVELVEALIPELPDRRRGRDPRTNAGQRRGCNQATHQRRTQCGQPLSDAATDVIATDDELRDAELVEQTDEAAHLSIGVVMPGGVHGMLVRLTEASQVGDDDVVVIRQPFGNSRVVGAIARPTMQQQDRRRRRRPVAVEGQPESVNGF